MADKQDFPQHLVLGAFDSKQQLALQRLFAHILDLFSLETADSRLTDAETDITNLNAWATALATKLNTDFVEQNGKAAFPLTLDTNYDTDPQA